MALWIKDSNEEGKKRPGAGLYSGSTVVEIPSGTSEDFDKVKDKLPIGSVYFVTDEKGEVYDDAERVIGSWFGKPIYRKILSYNENLTGTINKPHGLNIDNLVNIYGTYYGSTNNAKVPLNFPHYSNSNVDVGTFVQGENICIRIGESWTFDSAKIILEYTKVGD